MLKALRKQKGYTREMLGAAAHVSVRAIESYEQKKRRPPPEVAERLALVLGLTIEEMWAMFYAPKHDTA